MPRGYAMERRRQQVAATRDRILTASSEVFAARGARGTTLAEVARVADVSPTTVSNHFATQEMLLEAVIARLAEEVAIPGPEVLVGARTFPARVKAFTLAMFEFYERTNDWFRLLGDELTTVPAVAAADAEFRARVGTLLASALDDRADERLCRVAGGLIHPATLTALREAGWEVADAADLIAESVIHQARRRDSVASAVRRPHHARAPRM